MFSKIKNKITKLLGNYKEEKHNRISSYPFISGDSFISLADEIILQTYSKPLKSNFINNNDLIFIENDMLNQKWVLETALNYKKVILHNGDKVPSKLLLDKLLAESIKIYATNVKYQENKIFPIPIGLENSYLKRNGDLNYYNIFNFSEKKLAKDNMILVSFSVHNEIRKSYENILLEHNFQNQVGLDLKKYRQLLNKSFFVISPPGNGIDCHRTWESLILGNIVLLQSSPLDPLFEDLPVVIIKDFILFRV